jgi:cytochrome c oxidase assembly protein subunit 15
VGLLVSLLNLLILGSLLGGRGGDPLVPSALLWLPGSLILGAGLGALGGAAGAWVEAARRRAGRPAPPPPNWTAAFCGVAAVATFFLLIVGGVVTGSEAGLAVTDWPNSFGTNMFLFPLSRMTGGIYYEHAHRLFGALVGLATLAVAGRLWRVEARPWVRALAMAAVVVVTVQGLLGGLRVTGRLTLSTVAQDMAPSIGLAILHGVLGQVFLALMVVVAAATSRRWRSSGRPELVPSAAGDRTLQSALVGALVVQLVLGAIQRHLAQGLVIHITLAAFVAIMAIAVGARAWGLHHGQWPVQRLGQLLMGLVGIQVALGIAALAVTQGRAVVGSPTTVEVTIATAHQAAGAGLLALAVLLAAWTRRLYLPSAPPVRSAVEG